MMEPSQLYLVVLLGQVVQTVQLLPHTLHLIVGPVKKGLWALLVALVVLAQMVHTLPMLQ
jgi:hypothetical protein